MSTTMLQRRAQIVVHQRLVRVSIYTVVVYWVFRGKVRPGMHYH